jgi:hypothetical protein
MVVHGRGPRRTEIPTNTAGEIYSQLYAVRNAFLHGNPVTPESLRHPQCNEHILQFAAPLFRMALAAYLDLRFREEMPDFESDPEGAGHFVSARWCFNSPQRNAEEAILIADAGPRSDSD